MKYDFARYILDLDDGMLYFINASDDVYDGEEKAKAALSDIIKNETPITQDGLIYFYSISNIPSLSENNKVITITYYASATLDNVTKGKVAEYAKNHRMDCHFI